MQDLLHTDLPGNTKTRKSGHTIKPLLLHKLSDKTVQCLRESAELHTVCIPRRSAQGREDACKRVRLRMHSLVTLDCVQAVGLKSLSKSGSVGWLLNRMYAVTSSGSCSSWNVCMQDDNSSRCVFVREAIHYITEIAMCIRREFGLVV